MATSKKSIGKIRIQEIEKKMRKPRIRPSETIPSKKAYNRKRRKSEDQKLNESTSLDK